MRAAAPERMFSEMASAHAPSLRTISWPSGSLPFTATERLLQLKEENWLLPDGRLISPPGGSSLTTSAPRSANRRVAMGPAITLSMPSTLTPSSGGPSGPDDRGCG